MMNPSRPFAVVLVLALLMVGGGAAGAQDWTLTGNAGTDPGTHFVGTTDDKALEIRVNKAQNKERADLGLRLEPVIDTENFPVFGNIPRISVNLIGGISLNSVEPGVAGATIAGGGASYTHPGVKSSPHRVFGDFGTVGGGSNNQAGDHATVGGGSGNTANGTQSTVGGGNGNTAGYDPDEQPPAFSPLNATVGGGQRNKAIATNAVVGGGSQNKASNAAAVVGGGESNTASAHTSTVGGGAQNSASGEKSTVSGGGANGASADFATIGGGYSQKATEKYATVSGGGRNQASAEFATIGGGGTPQPDFPGNPNPERANRVTDAYGTVGGGSNNHAGNANPDSRDADFATVSGGLGNTASAKYATTGGGNNNTASDYVATIGGGLSNTASGDNATVGGGSYNIAEGFGATIPGGNDNMARGAMSFAAGSGARANGRGAFVWADASGGEFRSTADNQFNVRAIGGTRIASGFTADTEDITAGVRLASGGNGWQSLSDRTLKENITPVDGREILTRVSRLPITQWNLKAQAPAITHIGPMAQDFHALFGVGEDDRHITSVDADGVALAAIQGLHQLLQEREATITAQQQQLEALEARLASLEGMVKLLAPRP